MAVTIAPDLQRSEPRLPPPASGWLVVGFTTAAIGMALRLWAIRTLGRSFTSVVAVRQGQRVLSTGPYRRIRHPSYTGSLLTALGLAIAFRSAAGLCLVCAGTFPAYLYRMRVEERALLAALGDAYASYRARTWQLLPFVL